MENKKVAFCTLGCKVNQYETNGMIQEFKKCGYEIVEFDEFADIYVVNTCTVTNMADRKSRQMIRKVKEINPNAIIVAVGCYAQVAKEDLEKIPEIDLILGTNEKKNIVSHVEKILNEEKQTNIADVMHCEDYADFGDVTFTEKTRAVIKVQDGCDRFCSYCIIPFARGHIRSRRPESVISEITKIAEKGIKEVVITGIHLASYGRDFAKREEANKVENGNKLEDILGVNNQANKDENDLLRKNREGHNREYRLIDLLEDINRIDGIQRIRLRFVGANINYRRIC